MKGDAHRPKSPDKQERLAAALRENLKRRKEQQRARSGSTAPAKETDDSRRKA